MLTEQEINKNKDIQCKDIPDRHRDYYRTEIMSLRQKGIEFELNYNIATTTWLLIRKARGMILQSTLSEEELKNLSINERVEQKLNKAEINRLCNLVTMASVNCGALFWTKNLDENNKLLRIQTTILGKIRDLTLGVENQDDYSRVGNAQVLYTFNKFLVSYFENGPSDSDCLGEHFIFSGAHPFLDKISISELRKETQNGDTIVVLAAAASSGVLDAGIIAHYMNTVLGIPTTVDPVFFASEGTKKETNKISSFIRSLFSPGLIKESTSRFMNDVLPNQKTIVIPFDDQIIGSGFSPRQVKKAARRKYKSKNFRMSPLMRKV